MWVRGACIYHGVQPVQVAGLSLLHGEQALSWECAEQVRSCGGLLGSELFLFSATNCLARIVVEDWKWKAARMGAVRFDMQEQVYTTGDSSGYSHSPAVEKLSAVSLLTRLKTLYSEK